MENPWTVTCTSKYGYNISVHPQPNLDSAQIIALQAVEDYIMYTKQTPLLRLTHYTLFPDGKQVIVEKENKVLANFDQIFKAGNAVVKNMER